MSPRDFVEAVVAIGRTLYRRYDIPVSQAHAARGDLYLTALFAVTRPGVVLADEFGYVIDRVWVDHGLDHLDAKAAA